MRPSDEILDELKKLEEKQEPVEPRYKTNDATIEKLVELMQQNPRGILYFRDEMVGAFKRWESPGREQDRAFHIEAWSGNGSHTDDRIGRGTVRADNVCESLLGSIQPGKLAGYLDQAISQGDNDGFMQRLQLGVYPDVPPYRHVDEWPNREARDRAYRIIKVLAS
jgi:hypothetical protein